MKKKLDHQLPIEREDSESLVDFIERVGETIFCLTAEEQTEVDRKKAAYARWVKSHAARHTPKVHARPAAKQNPKMKRPVSA